DILKEEMRFLMFAMLFTGVALLAAAQSSDVRIEPSTYKGETGAVAMQPNSFAARGYTLKQIVAWISKVGVSRVVLPASLDSSDRYDFSVSTPGRENDAAVAARIEKAVLARFKISIARQTQPRDVFILTAHPTAAMRPVPVATSGTISS